MRKLMILLLALLLLAGCGADMEPTLPPTEPTQPPLPWVEEVGMQWDTDGVLTEIPLTIPDGLHYNAAINFDGDLLLWSMDAHLEKEQSVEMCLIELDDGSIAAQREVTVGRYVIPQVVDSCLYLCDGSAGSVIQLDKSLKTMREWTFEGVEGTVHIGVGGTAYWENLDSHLLALDLETGETSPVLEGDPAIAWTTTAGDTIEIKYYRNDNGAPAFAVLDLVTGECRLADTDEQIDSVHYFGDTWLYEKYMDSYIYYLYTGDNPGMRVAPGGSLMSVGDDRLLETSMDGTCLRLYELDGTLCSSCVFYETGTGYLASDLIWNEEMGGYFFLARSYDETSRLLFWDVEKTSGGEDLTLSPIPEPDGVQAELEARADELGEKYGLTILVGTQCDTAFDEFTATQATDWDRVMLALDTLDRALAVYPEGFIRQLRYDYIQGVRIQLVTDLMADGSGRYGDGYNAFTQPQFDYYLMVIDIEDSFEQTYYHEFSHIIDRCLEADADAREDALYSEAEWASLNPGWFDGYTLDYSWEQNLEDVGWFIDGYSTIKPTEDRARVMEYAMTTYGQWEFEHDGLYRKLDYYCRCIRDCFDTTGWPDRLLWEQYL